MYMFKFGRSEENTYKPYIKSQCDNGCIGKKYTDVVADFNATLDTQAL